ncbi:recombination protein F [Aquisphaera giovannonii]|uniref:Recombination protein F n=1 Tax=Aquisphaera giovannonii TaxID=406548 RepID=A0A5B9WGN5_9BACT|nr:ATP-binding protein [Aquisphaera giovannonii]QEH39171.1 recombination protein F [Aquisphaera giovannonii]
MLKQVDIKNFRSCYGTSVTCGEGVCAIVGRNGVGKTNVLKCIDWVASSSVSTDPVRVAQAGNASEGLDEVSATLGLELDGRRFEYSLCIPLPDVRRPRRADSVRDLLSLLGDAERTDIFRREGEKIVVAGRPEPIRVARSAPSLAALLSLLPEDDELRSPLLAVSSFFAGVRYYGLEEPVAFRDYVPEEEYNNWLIKYQGEGLPTSSVALRLIYMKLEDTERFEELESLLGPDGLGLLEDFDVLELNRSLQPNLLPELDTKTKIYLPVFTPSGQMGGAGKPFPFSDLSAGTRRVIRIVTSLLFDKRSLMLMEQPEDSVHPGLLRKLIDMLRSYSDRSQILFTTHSADVLDILRPEEVLMATAQDGGTSVRPLSPDEASRARRFLKDEGSLSDFLEPFD